MLASNFKSDFDIQSAFTEILPLIALQSEESEAKPIETSYLSFRDSERN